MSDGTGNAEPVGETVDQYPQAFTPDGTIVIYERYVPGARADIGTLSLEGERRSTLLLDSEFGERNPALSRDGRWIAYESDESGRTEIYVRPFPDVNAARWQISTDGGQWPVWSPNSNELFYRGPLGVIAHGFDTEPSFRPGRSEFLFAWEFVAGTARRMSVSPDGARFLMLKDAVEGDAQNAQVILVENWFEELKGLVPTND